VVGLFPEWFAPFQLDWPQNTHPTGFVMNDDGGRRRVIVGVQSSAQRARHLCFLLLDRLLLH